MKLSIIYTVRMVESACSLMPNHCHFSCVCACVSIRVCVRACTAFVCCQLFVHSMPYCYVYLSDWLFYSGFWVNQSPSSSPPSSSSSSFFGYCPHGTQRTHSVFGFLFLLPLPPSSTMLTQRPNRNWLDSCFNVLKYALCIKLDLCVRVRVCLYVCLITRKAIIKHQYTYTLHWVSEWNPNKFRAANNEQKKKKSEWSLNRESER